MLKPEDVGCQLPPEGPCLGTVVGKLSPGLCTGFPTNTEGGTEPPLQEGLQLQEMGLWESARNMTGHRGQAWADDGCPRSQHKGCSS